MCINVYYQQVHFHSVVLAPARGDLIVYLVEPGGWVDTRHWTNDSARVLYLVVSTVQDQAPDGSPVDECNIMIGCWPGQTRQSSHQTAVSTPARPG